MVSSFACLRALTKRNMQCITTKYSKTQYCELKPAVKDMGTSYPCVYSSI